MKRKEIIDKLSEIFVNVLDLDENPHLKEETTANDIEEWDSLAHIQLVVAIQKDFSLKFTAQEIMGWNKVGDIIDSIEKNY